MLSLLLEQLSPYEMLQALLVMMTTIHSASTKRSSGTVQSPSFLPVRMHECAEALCSSIATQRLLRVGFWAAVSGNAGLATTAEAWWKPR